MEVNGQFQPWLLHHGERCPMGGWVDPRASQDATVKGKSPITVLSLECICQQTMPNQDCRVNVPDVLPQCKYNNDCRYNKIKAKNMIVTVITYLNNIRLAEICQVLIEALLVVINNSFNNFF
jgi:hypothetical protein